MIKKTATRKPRASRPRMEPTEETVHPIPETEPMRSNGTTRLSPLTIGLIVIILVTALILGVKSIMTPPAPAAAPTPAPAAAPTPVPTSTPEEVQALISKVVSLLPVKETESPTVATIQDANMLRAQDPAFYKDAQIGDKLLIWSDQAVLYSPSQDKILSVLPISLPANVGTSSTTTGQTAETATIEVRNGAGVAGLGGKTVTKLKAAGLTVLPATDAKSKTIYPTSFLIVKQGASYPKTIAKIQGIVPASVTVLPAVEAPMKGDILLILGADAGK